MVYTLFDGIALGGVYAMKIILPGKLYILFTSLMITGFLVGFIYSTITSSRPKTVESAKVIIKAKTGSSYINFKPVQREP
jgi:hypothetical protein